MTANSLPITLETVTPIWTGGAKGEADRLHVTGIMGSLRWWYEALVRGVGGNACDPGQHSCSYEKGLCDVCRIFGATGWARRFRLIVMDERELRPESPPNTKFVAARSYVHLRKDGTKETVTPKWQLKSPARKGTAKIKIVATDPTFQLQVIGGLIQFLGAWASIGAKPQMGFGLVKVTPYQDTSALLSHLQTIAGTRAYANLPMLSNMFFASITASKSSLEETFNLKYDLRRLYGAKTDTDLRHFVMGTIKGDHQGAKIMMSRPYNGNTIQVWGWMPEEVARFGTTRAKVVGQIHGHLKRSYPLSYWREFDSPLDTKNKYSNILEFLESLLRGER